MRGRPASTRLADDFRARPNSLGALRLGLACLVVIAHAWQLGGYGEPPMIGGVYLSAWGLLGFFAISGFLITRSRLSRPSVLAFAWARLLRIYPGFIVCVLVVAFVAAPLSTRLEAGTAYSLHDAVEYVARNLLLYPPYLHASGIGSTLATAPFSGNWDEPLWSLFYEACCYAVIGVAVSLLPRRSLRIVVPTLFVLATVMTFATGSGWLAAPYELSIGSELLSVFLGGSTLCVLAPYLPSARWDVVVSGGLLVFAVLSGYASGLCALPLAHLLIRASTLLPLSRVGRRWDISYGVYIYGSPVMQLVVLASGRGALPLPLYVAVVLATVAPVAFASSALVEMPALRLKDRNPVAMIRAARRARIVPITSA